MFMQSSKIFRFFIVSSLVVCTVHLPVQGQNPLRLGLDGLSHGHVFWVFNHPDSTTFELVGIAEPNQELAARLAKQYGFSMDLIFTSLQEMVEATSPEAVMAFNSTFEHLNTVRVCAPAAHLDVSDPPMAFMAGELDDPSTRAEPTRQRLDALGIANDFLIFENAPHNFLRAQEWFDESIDFMDQFFGDHLNK